MTPDVSGARNAIGCDCECCADAYAVGWDNGHQAGKEDAKHERVWAVVFSDCFPQMVDSLWWSRESAVARCESQREVEMDGRWRVDEWRVR